MMEYILLLIVFVVLIFCYLIYRELTKQKEPVLKLEGVANVLGRSVDGVKDAAHTVDKEVGRLLEQAKLQKEIRDEVRAMREVIIGTTTRGVAGEKLLQRTLSSLPSTMIEHNLSLSTGVVEFALKFPDGKYLPIDSKFPYFVDFEKLSEMGDDEKKKSIKILSSNFKKKVDEVSKYVNDEKTISFAIAAFPDSIYSLINDHYPYQISEAFKRNVIATSYSNVPQILVAILQIREFYGVEIDIERTLTNLGTIKNLANQIDKIIDNRLDKSNIMIGNAIRAIRANIERIKARLEDIRVEKEE